MSLSLKKIVCELFVAVGLCAGLLFCNLSHAYLMYVPPSFQPRGAKMVVVIHGCLQSAESMALGTGWNQIADRHNLVVLYPQVPDKSSPISCWGWYLPENQRADSGQLKGVMDQIQWAKRVLSLQNPDIYLTGISSGGATVAGLMACYPKSFKSAAIHSGISYGLAQTHPEGDRVLKEGPPPPSSTPDLPCSPGDYRGSVMVLHGAVDTVVNSKHVNRLIGDFLGNVNPVSTEEFTEGGTFFTQTEYLSSTKARGRTVIVAGLAHAWAGFVQNLRHGDLLGPKTQVPTRVPFFTDFGPSSTNLIWKFFSEETARAKK